MHFRATGLSLLGLWTAEILQRQSKAELAAGVKAILAGGNCNVMQFKAFAQAIKVKECWKELLNPNPRIRLSVCVCVSVTKRPHLTHYPQANTLSTAAPKLDSG